MLQDCLPGGAQTKGRGLLVLQGESLLACVPCSCVWWGNGLMSLSPEGWHRGPFASQSSLPHQTLVHPVRMRS